MYSYNKLIIKASAIASGIQNDTDITSRSGLTPVKIDVGYYLVSEEGVQVLLPLKGTCIPRIKCSRESNPKDLLNWYRENLLNLITYIEISNAKSPSKNLIVWGKYLTTLYHIVLEDLSCILTPN